MIIPPLAFAFESSPAPELQLQPAGYDLTLKAVAQFRGQGALDLSNAKRALPVTEELAWEGLDSEEEEEESVGLAPGAYLVTYNEEVAVPLCCAAIVLPRSSLLRCGAVLHSALWDPGYRGRGQGLLSVTAPLRLYKNARIGQIVFFRLETEAAAGYTGVYQSENL